MLHLTKEIQEFVSSYPPRNLSRLLLQKPLFAGTTNRDLVQQIEGIAIAKKKFPFMLKEGIIFPKKMNLEQASSEATAKWKADDMVGNRYLDLTGGSGIDAYFMSEGFKEVTIVEPDRELVTLLRHNWKTFGRKANFWQDKAEDFLQNDKDRYDCIYLDPSRRDAYGTRKFLLDELEPNPIALQPLLRAHTNRVVMKLSPMADLKYLFKMLENIAIVAIIAVKNEVKELVIVQHYDKKPEEVLIHCANLETKEPDVSFFYDEIEQIAALYAPPKHYLYIPNNAILKSGAFNYIVQRFGVEKLEANTHLYTSDRLITTFAGRVLEVEEVDIDEIIGGKYNIISKNYPLSVDELKKKCKLTEGGEDYLIFTRSIRGIEILRGKLIDVHPDENEHNELIVHSN